MEQVLGDNWTSRVLLPERSIRAMAGSTFQAIEGEVTHGDAFKKHTRRDVSSIARRSPQGTTGKEA